jgi:hypothetical protein
MGSVSPQSILDLSSALISSQGTGISVLGISEQELIRGIPFRDVNKYDVEFFFLGKTG